MTRRKEEALGLAGTDGFRDQDKAGATILANLEADHKAFQTLRAQLALEGHALSRTEAGDGLCSYFVSRWGMVRELRDIDAVRAFARQVGVTHG